MFMEKTSTGRLAAPSMTPSKQVNRSFLKSTWPAHARSEAPGLTLSSFSSLRRREELERRLIGRGTESPEEQARRLATARVELEAASEFDHVVINDDVERAVDELARLIGLE